MTGITHKQAGRYMRADLDGLLTDIQRRDLQTHLDECEACRLESESFSLLTARLKNDFQARWDTQHGPSHNVMANVKSQTRRINMSKQIDLAFNIFGGIVTLLVLAFAVSSVASQFQKNTSAASEPQSISSSPPSDARLLAFTSNQDGNLDIYTMYVDGSGLTNLTNNPARDVDPVWSPDGKHIAFESDRDGFMQIYVMNADGSNVIQLTNNKADHIMSLNYNRSLANPWSPDGNQLVILQKVDAEKWMLYALDVNDGTMTPLVQELGIYGHATWSPDGKHVAFISNDSQSVSLNSIYVVDTGGSNLTEVTQNLPMEEIPTGLFAPDYYWSRDGQSIFFVASNLNYITKNGLGSDSKDIYNWNAYEVSLDGNLTLNATTHSPIGGWWQGDYFTTPLTGTQGWTWVRVKSTTTLDPFRNCADTLGSSAHYQQSSNGNVVIGAKCPNFEWWLYWVNPKGTMLALIDSPIKIFQGDMQNLVWSQDDKFIAFDITTTDKTDMYIVNVAEALKDPSVQPIKISLGDGSLNFNMSWQPIP